MRHDKMKKALLKMEDVQWELSPHQMHVIALAVDHLLKSSDVQELTDNEYKSLCAISDKLDDLPIW